MSLESYHYGVTPIYAKIRDDEGKIATGFFYKDIEKEDTPYLVTNRHVAVNEKCNFYPKFFEIIIHTSRESIRQVRVLKIPLYSEDMKPTWLEYPHIETTFIDVVVINLQQYIRVGDQIQYWSSNDIVSRAQIHPQGSQIRVIGYPMGFHDHVHNVPIARHATIASPYDVSFIGEPFYLVDGNFHKGMSGSPVIIPRSFLRVKNKTMIHSLLGIHSAGYEVNVLDGCENKKIDLGLGVVWYPDLIQKIIRNQERGLICN